jgi:glycine oxidase
MSHPSATVTTSSGSPDLLIIGGGVIGSACAYYAAKAGLSVQVIDARTKPGRASPAAAGLIAPSPQLTEPSPFATLALASVTLFPALRGELLEESGIDIGLDLCGTLRLATSEGQAESQRRRLPKQQHLGLQLEWLSAEEVRTLEPGLTGEVVGAVYGPSEGKVDGTRLLAAYVAAAQRHGAQFISGTVRRLVTDKSRVTGVRTRDRCIGAGQVLIATGAWAADMREWLGVELPITPERGQTVTAKHMAHPLRHIIFAEQIYLAPKARHGVLVGAARDRCGYESRTTLAAISDLLGRALRVHPGLAGASLGTARAGLRPRTPDGCPIVGELPGWRGISVAAGHNSNGLLFSAITGQLVAAQHTGATIPIDPAPYGLSRFSVA